MSCLKKFIREHDLKPRALYDSDENIRNTLVHISVYFCFVILTTIVALTSRHSYMFYFNNAINQHFSVVEHYATIEDWWAYIVNSYIPDFLQVPAAALKNSTNITAPAATNATRRRRAAKRRPGIKDQHARSLLEQNVIMGPPRLRQIRVVREDCVEMDVFEHFKDCYPAYSASNEDTTERFKSTKFGTQTQLRSTNIYGRISTYVGGGYVQSLSREVDEAIQIANDLYAKGWIDRATRLIVIEYTIYNENTELFNNVKFFGEMLPTGSVLLSSQVKALKLDGVWEGLSWLTVVGVIFYLMALFYAIKEVFAGRAVGCRAYMLDTWNWVDITILLLVLLSFIYNIWHPLHLHNVLDDAYHKPDEYQSLDVISLVNSFYLDTVAICAFLVWIKLFLFMRFNKTALQLNSTFVRCYKDLLGFLLIFVILFMSYAWLGFLLFGTEHSDFHNFGFSFWTVMRMVLCDFDYFGVKHANRLLGPLYFLSFILLVYFILINMFLAIVIESFGDVKDTVEDPSKHIISFGKNCYSKTQQLAKKLFNLICCKKPKEAQKAKPDPNLDEVQSDHEPPFPPKPKPPTERVRVNPLQLLRDYFESVRSKENAEQLDSLAEHITALEEILSKMSDEMKRLDTDLQSESEASHDTVQGPAPPRRKIFVPRFGRKRDA